MDLQVLTFLMRTLADFSCHSDDKTLLFPPLSSITFLFRKAYQLSLWSMHHPGIHSTIRPSLSTLPLQPHPPCGIARLWLRDTVPSSMSSADGAPLRPAELLYSLNPSHTPNFCLSSPKKKKCSAWPVGISCFGR